LERESLGRERRRREDTDWRKGGGVDWRGRMYFKYEKRER
jgi:hypothetical protein